MPYRKNLQDETPTWHPPQAGPELKLRIKVVTPMFGGGYEARNVDEVVPIRAAAIRGQLRFWWRATAGAKYTTAEELFEREAEVWGSAAEEGKPGGQGKVGLQVTTLDIGKAVSAKDLIPKATAQDGPLEGVFLFPFQEQKKDDIPFASARKHVQFEVKVSWQDDALSDQVKTALIAWLLFGGVGARTRRGCGALRLVDALEGMPSSLESMKAWLATLPKPVRRPWPTLSYCVPGSATTKPQEAWQKLGRFWSAIRKGHIGATEYQPMKGGKWSDHETLRSLPPNATTIALSKPFLGLPIVYQQFTGAFDGQLEPDESGRYGSPVILKPLCLGETVHPIVLVMFSPAPAKLKIKGRERIMTLKVPPGEPLLSTTKHPLVAVVREAESFLNAKAIACGGAS